MNGAEIKLLSLASALIASAALAACGDDSALRFSAEDTGKQMPEPKKLAKEKCYGVALAQMNDCATRQLNDCAGTAEEDYLPAKWKWVPAGQCAELQGMLIEPEEVFISEK